MTAMVVMAMFVSTKTMSPISLAITILVLSMMATIPMYKISTSSWISFILIITFSSGMMTLFMYTASLLNNEVNKTKKTKKMLMLMLTTAAIPNAQQTKTQTTMKTFSKSSMMMMMASMLIITMIAIVAHGHSPHQTLNSSF